MKSTTIWYFDSTGEIGMYVIMYYKMDLYVKRVAQGFHNELQIMSLFIYLQVVGY